MQKEYINNQYESTYIRALNRYLLAMGLDPRLNKDNDNSVNIAYLESLVKLVKGIR